MGNRHSCCLPPLQYTSEHYFTPSHHLTSYYLITPLYFWHCWHKPTHLLYVRSWQQLWQTLQAALWHMALVGTVVLSSLNEDHAGAFWVLAGYLAHTVGLSVMTLWMDTRGTASGLNGIGAQQGDDLHMLWDVGLTAYLNLWNDWRGHSYSTGTIISKNLLYNNCMFSMNIKAFGPDGFILWSLTANRSNIFDAIKHLFHVLYGIYT